MNSIKNIALVVVDLQKGITTMKTKPYASEIVIANSVKLVNKFREQNLPVFLINVDFLGWDSLQPITDIPQMKHDLPEWWSDFIDDLNVQESDIIITKRQWWAFYGTELDLQLRRRNIDTLVLCWIATSFWVESTARCAFELWYNQIFSEDAMSSRNEIEHDFTINNIFPKIGQVKSTDETLLIIDNLQNVQSSLWI